MKFKGTKISKRTVALFAAALVLLGSGGVLGTRAVPAIQSATFGNEIVLDGMNVQLLNDGKEVGADEGVDDGLERSERTGVGEDDGRELFPVQASVFLPERDTEESLEFRDKRRIGIVEKFGPAVRIVDGNPPGREKSRNGGFPASDSPCDGYCLHYSVRIQSKTSGNT